MSVSVPPNRPAHPKTQKIQRVKAAQDKRTYTQTDKLVISFGKKQFIVEKTRTTY